MLEKLEFLAILAPRKAGNRKDIGTVDRIPKLDVEGSNPFARSERNILLNPNLGIPSVGRKCGF
jgi:hypothetical protein